MMMMMMMMMMTEKPTLPTLKTCEWEQYWIWQTSNWHWTL